ncbi:MAG: DUF3006 domain-containing protein [Elusimicrobia bacterium]|nr:DUF3006 domain-containing protein [Elusimicrobiota bacterium]
MKCVVDRIEEGVAVIIVKGGGKMEIPVKQFPFEIKEGMFLKANFTGDSEERERVKRSIKKIRGRLRKRSG